MTVRFRLAAFLPAARAEAAALGWWLAAESANRQQMENMLAAHAVGASFRARDPERLEQSLLEFLRWTGDYDALLNHHPALRPHEELK